MKYLTRVITFEAYPQITDNNPRTVLEQGSRVLMLEDKARVFVVRKVAYDDITPIYATPIYSMEVQYKNIKELLECHPGLKDKPVLDLDKSLEIYDNE